MYILRNTHAQNPSCPSCPFSLTDEKLVQLSLLASSFSNIYQLRIFYTKTMS